MAGETQEFETVGEDWTDLVAGNVALDSVDVMLTFRGSTGGAEAELVLGGAAEPDVATVAGLVMGHLDTVVVNSDHLWVRAITRGGRIAPVVL
jgi:hypothetical protein